MIKDIWRNVNEKCSLYIGVVSLFLAVVGFIVINFFYILPMIEQLEKNMTNEEQYLKKFELLEAYALKHDQYDIEYSELQLKHERLIAKIPSKLVAKDVIVKMQKIAEQCKVDFIAKSIPENRRNKDSLGYVGVKLELKGEYSSVLRFLKNMEQQGNVKIDLFNLKANSKGQLTISCFLKQYFYS